MVKVSMMGVWGLTGLVVMGVVLPTGAEESETALEEAGALAESGTLGAMDQVMSVSQLKDVEPTDWAFQALQGLVERYGCVTGFPDGTFRGDRALGRYEFAAGLSACLDWLTERIDTLADKDFVSPGDLATLRRLQEEFEVELTTLRGRLINLEASTTALEAQQFSTTTRLNGLVFFNLTGAGAGDEVQAEGPGVFSAARDPGTGQPVVRQVDDPEITFSALAWLTLNSSFTGKDNLRLNLAVGNGDSPANQYVSAGLYNTYGVPFTDQAPSAPNDVVVRDFEYLFPVGDRLRLVVGPRINWYRYFDENAFTLFLNGASSFNASGGTLVNAVDRGAGAVALWPISNKIRLNFGYLGENTEFLPGSVFNSSSNPQQGLFGGTYTATAELVVSPTPRANLRLLYTRSRLQQIGGLVGGAIGEPLLGLADDGLGGPLYSSTADTFSANFDWQLGDRLGLFGRYAYGSTNIFPKNAALAAGEVNAQSFQLGLAFPDLGKEGALGTLSFGVPFDVLEGRRYLVSGGGNGGTQYEVEATYFYPLTENIAIAPAFYVISNPNNFDDNPTIFIGNLRTQFSF